MSLSWEAGRGAHTAKGPYPLGDFGVIGGTIGRRWPIVPLVTGLFLGQLGN